ncbi:zinc ABC transporter substrate-binding protein [Falsirhodobacter algicola]|uniref:High-affinity zinc uptake system protein ZnuA n=1 Tax=Falsirhodobacter algicola TaxID=2692330 RepID=A0A8J8SKW1_9RHOB|nr:zinc ABC transporter substrate-binding protein [Falsirhodobacter algicola]QUS35803.1 zinc ABC transporter solute-binding protein [Falsirhodobacter algicola]
MRYTISLALASLCTPAFADVKVVTDISPVHSLVAQVMEGVGTPDELLPMGADPHHFQLRPSQARNLQDADLVIWAGPEMSPWLSSTLSSLSADDLQLLHVEGLHAHQYAADAHDDEDEDEDDHAGHDHDDHADHDHHDHDDHDEEEGEEHHHHDGLDPHAWLNPDNAILWLGAIAEKLSAIDPDNAATYAANAERAEAGIEELDAKLKAELAPIQGKSFVVFHDAYTYFTEHYGLSLAGSISPGDASSPSAARLAAIRNEAGPSTCIFPEVQHDPKLSAQMAEDADVKLGDALDPEGSQLEPGPQLYATLMETLSSSLVACLK